MGWAMPVRSPQGWLVSTCKLAAGLKWVVEPTERSVLKGEGSNIPHPLNRVCHRCPGEPLADDKADAAEIIGWAPSSLQQHIVLEKREPQLIEVASFGEVCEVCASGGPPIFGPIGHTPSGKQRC